MGEYLVLHYRSILVDEDIFNGESGNFGEQDSAEGVGDAGVEADEGEGRVEG